MKNVLSIAGSDPSGGAGIQADLKTMCALGVYGMTAITAVTVQNTTGVFGVQEIDPAVVAGQVDAVLDDFPADAIKIGMIGNADAMRLVRDSLLRRKARSIVLDPVMMSKSGCRLISHEVERELITLFPVAEVVTPNLAEAGALAGMAIASPADMPAAAQRIRELGARAVLVKGGAWPDNCDDFLLTGDGGKWFPGPRIDTRNTHGTGCTLSTAIACHLALGLPLAGAVDEAKRYVTQTIRDALPPGRGVGPLGHLVQLYKKAGLSS